MKKIILKTIFLAANFFILSTNLSFSATKYNYDYDECSGIMFPRLVPHEILIDDYLTQAENKIEEKSDFEPYYNSKYFKIRKSSTKEIEQ